MKQHKLFRVTLGVAAGLTKRFMIIKDLLNLVPVKSLKKRVSYKKENNRMKEQFLLDYLQNKITIEELATNLKGAQRKASSDVTSVYVDPIKWNGEFEITKVHLLQLCNDALSRKLLFADLNTIAFAIITSEFFTHDQNDEITDRVLSDWDNPEIGFPLTEENMKKWKELLETGVDTFGLIN